MKKITITVCSILGLLLSLSLFAREIPLSVSYGDVMREFDQYLHTLDTLEGEAAYFQQLAAMNIPFAADQANRRLNERENVLRHLTAMAESLDRAQVDLANALLGSPTGVNTDGSATAPDQQQAASLPSARRPQSTLSQARRRHVSSSSDTDSDDSDTESEPDDIDSVTDMPGLTPGSSVQRRRLATTKKLLNQKASLSLEQIRMASGLGSVGFYGRRTPSAASQVITRRQPQQRARRY